MHGANGTNYWIKGNLLLLLQDFLSNRFQSVRIASSISAPILVTSGVPQGSVLGPLLFNLFINDITDNFTNITAKLFADDIKLYTSISDLNSNSDFQHHLDLIYSWSYLWQIPISYSKCSILHLGPSTNKPTFNLDSVTLSDSTSIKDLGILIDPSLKFTTHIHSLSKRARQRSALIYRSFLSRNLSNLILAYTTYVRPLLEYASPAWSPFQISLIDSFEKVQRSSTKRLPGMANLTYAQRLSITQLQSLEHRRLICDLTTCFNIVKGFSAIPLSAVFTPSPNLTSRGHPLRLLVPLSKSNIRHHFFACRIVKVWNSLPTALVLASSTHTFKLLLSHHNLSPFLISPTIL